MGYGVPHAFNGEAYSILYGLGFMAENMEKHRWVKWPEPGQIRGDGTWVTFDSLVQNHGAEEDDWSYYKATGYLPTHEGPTPPEGT